MTFSIALINEPPRIPIESTVAFKMGNAFRVPEVAGVYFFHDLRGIIYVGRTENLNKRFKEHYWKQKNEILLKAISNPIGIMNFSWKLCEFPEQVTVERNLIRSLKPPCNRTSFK
ncbi:GIY-YIG nuclease family protein [Planomicrobium okeanokoites]|uniref:GIY-YIG nuclease family protein n=1 Tax=Planomicrobium okeanokoites TaxID=244 RepID=UPI000A05518E|nr:GIY-YIG nuclease family protein [Planomicrobium okeanokoites]